MKKCWPKVEYWSNIKYLSYIECWSNADLRPQLLARHQPLLPAGGGGERLDEAQVPEAAEEGGAGGGRTGETLGGRRGRSKSLVKRRSQCNQPSWSAPKGSLTSI